MAEGSSGIETWTLERVASLVQDGITESLTLDYKSSAALQNTDLKKKELTKDVSAMANAAGGVLIYGVREDGIVPKEFDEGLDPTDVSKEWIENVLNSSIHPRISVAAHPSVPAW